MDYVRFMDLALAQARTALDQGEFPVGCVVVQNNRVIAEGSRKGTGPDNSFFSEVDHAEIRALKNLESCTETFIPSQAVLFATMEPCLMCYGAIILSGIKTIVYAYEDVMGGGTACDLSGLPPLYRDCNITVVPGICRQKSLDLFCEFFNKKDNLYWKDSILEAYTLDQGRR